MVLRFILMVLLLSIFHLSSGLGKTDEIDSLLNELELKSNDITKCKLLNDIADEYISINTAEAIQYATEALDLSISLNYQSGIADSYMILGEAFEDEFQYEKALDKYLSSLALQKNLKHEENVAWIYYRLGRICKTIGNYEKGLEYCLNALRIREKNKQYIQIANIYNTMGSIYKYIGEYDQSLEYYLKCMNIEEDHREKGVSARILNNIGIIYNLMDDHEESLKYYRKSLIIRKLNNNTLDVASSYNNIGVVYLNRDNLDSAYYYLSRSLLVKEKYADEKELINIYNNLGDYYLRLENIDSSLLYVLKAVEIAERLKIFQSINASYSNLRDIHKYKGNYEKALEYQEKKAELKDSVLNTEKTLRIAQLASLYEKELEEMEHSLEEQRSFFINLSIYGVLFFLLVISVFIYLNMRSKLEKNDLKRITLEMEKTKLSTELETKNKELTGNIIHLSEKNKLLDDLRKSLQKIMCKLKDENKPQVQSLINDMKASQNAKIWDEFEVQFVNVHSNFYDNLCNDFPNLTQNEKRLAAFLKLNMSSKEISMITKQSTHSITVARTRLRKKIGLANTDLTLSSFFSRY